MSDAATFPAGLEPEYRAARFAEYRTFAIALGVAAVALSLALWLRDYASDAAVAWSTMPVRGVMAGAVAVYVASLWLPARRGLRLASGALAILVIEFAVLSIWGRLAGGYAGGLPGYMYIYLVAPLVLLPFSFRESVAVLVMAGAVPNVQVALGLAPGFPVLSFNALVWPACGIAIFAQRQFDQLFRRVYLTQRQLARLAAHDPLTGLSNRRDFMERAEAACSTARRYGRELCVLMLDLDHFKRINDTCGHAAGDDVLRFIAATLALQLRGADLTGRIGGEEFAVVLPETGLEAGLQTAERIRAAVERAAIPTAHAPQPLQVTVSIGLAARGASGTTLPELLHLADGALYEAKRAGRNRVRPASGATRRAVPA
jgi:diguanylate cyclase (GGDEF)-like protein